MGHFICQSTKQAGFARKVRGKSTCFPSIQRWKRQGRAFSPLDERGIIRYNQCYQFQYPQAGQRKTLIGAAPRKGRILLISEKVKWKYTRARLPPNQAFEKKIEYTEYYAP